MYFTLHRLLRKLIKEVGIVNSLCKLTCTPTNWQKKEEILDNHVGFLFPWNSHTQLDAQLYKCSNNVYIAGSVNCSTNLFSNYLFCLTFLSTWVHNSFFSWVRVVQSSVVVYCLFMFYLQFLITPFVYQHSNYGQQPDCRRSHKKTPVWCVLDTTLWDKVCLTVSDLRQSGDFRRVLWVPPSIKLTHDIT